MILLNTVSTPQVAKANKIENTATITIRLEDSALVGSVTLFLNSSTDSLIYVNIPNYFSNSTKEIVIIPAFGTGGETSFYFAQDILLVSRTLFQDSHGRRDSNSRHLVLETSALPTELHPFVITSKGIP